MNQHTLKTLEFEKILVLIEGGCRTPYGHEEVRALEPLYDIVQIRQRLDEHAQMKDIINFGAAFPLSRLEDDYRELLARSQTEGISLSPTEIKQVRELVEISLDIKNYDPEGRDKFEAIVPYIQAIRGYPELRDQIKKTIDDDGTIKDSASGELKRLRRELGDTRAKILSKLRKVLNSAKKQPGWQDDVITQRNGRYVIPVPSSQYQSDMGMLHDRSHSGSTFFIEPTDTVESNNKLNLLAQEEQIEIDRILRALTAEIGRRGESLIENCSIVGRLDAIYAAASFAKKTVSTKPQIVESAAFNLIEARHPLLLIQMKDKSLVVPNTIGLNDDRQALIITGPNTGGKTILLKTIGLLIVMAQSGLLIPANEKSEIGIFKEIYTDIGDEQSIELSLSTFSSHVKNIISAVRHLSADSLVLFDEIGAGTDPKEGAALAEAIILHMLNAGARLIVTTHYSQLKTLPLEYAAMENGSLEFDRETLAPTYRLQRGIPGSSYAVEIAQRLGMPTAISEHAATLLGQTERSLTELIASLETDLAQVRADKSELADRLERAARLEAEYTERLKQFTSEIDEARSEALLKSQNLLDQTRRETEKLVADIRKSQAQEKDIKKLHRTVSQRKRHVEKNIGKINRRKQPHFDPGLFAVGDSVRIISLGQAGEIVEKIGNQKAKIMVGHVTTTVELRNLERLESQGQSTPRPHATKLNTTDSGFSPEIHLRGMTVDEALEALDKFIDQAIIAGLTQVYVIHGKGAGILRRKLTDYLNHHKEIDSLRIGNWNEGGAGVTIAKLKS